MAKKLITLFIISLVLCGCSIQQKMPRDLPDSDKKAVYTEKITPAIDYVNELAKQKHIAPTLSDDFFDKYMDMKDFNRQKVRTLAGFVAVQNTIGLTEAEYQMWNDIIEEADDNLMTSADMEAKEKELEGLLNKAIADNNLSKEEYMKNLGITKTDMEAFLKEMSNRFYQSNEEVDMAVQNLNGEKEKGPFDPEEMTKTGIEETTGIQENTTETQLQQENPQESSTENPQTTEKQEDSSESGRYSILPNINQEQKK